ncbi:hypothetical protein ABID82_007143 [Methylobacterium sp. PvP062]|uniref:Uncharacterized protein n=1 Tax=Methylobacterium radiotolerans TaxID=31998 RepID=A0ABV2NTX0_9HYPH|nr:MULTISPECIES: hypothetical protein [unclassified Methylobacterium]MBP2498334.1 hypothetical protein [Methylobacterium sp. PvP105]MBP2505718.1 hypothetical protein [Methylobacterium sp. PvP109]
MTSDPVIVQALAIIEKHHVKHGQPSVLEMQDVEAAMGARVNGHVLPEELAQDTLEELGWHVEMVDGEIYRLERAADRA